MTLTQYLDNAWIQTHETSAEELADLLAIVDRDIEQSEIPELAAAWRFGIAYNAALQLAIAALAASGYRPQQQNAHQRSIECLKWTLELEETEVRFLDVCRRKRHQNVYDRVGAVSDQEADELLNFARSLRVKFVDWLKQNHREFWPK